MSRWSDNREKLHKSEKKLAESLIGERLTQLNLLLRKLAEDEDLHDDLTLPEVRKAMKHWTGEHRLSPEDSVSLQDHRRVVYVLQRLQMFQAGCKEAGINKIPLDLFLKRTLKVPEELIPSLFGLDLPFNSNETQSKISTQDVDNDEDNPKDGDTSRNSPVFVYPKPILQTTATYPEMSSYGILPRWLGDCLLALVTCVVIVIVRRIFFPDSTQTTN